MNPLIVAIPAVIVALAASGLAGLTTWRWLTYRRENRALRRRLALHRTRAADTGRLNDLFDREP